MDRPPIQLRREVRAGALGLSLAIYWLEMDRPERLNALSRPLVEALLDALGSIADDPEAHVVVLSGSTTRSFIGGADIDELAALDAESATGFIARIHTLCAALRALPVPVLAVIRGYCLGAGLEVACSCDLRLAAQQAQFGMPEVHLGIPSVIEAALLPRYVGIGRARDLVLTGRLIDGAQAQRWGLVEASPTEEDLAAVVEDRLGSLLEATPQALRAQKRLCREWEELGLEDGVNAGIAAFAQAWQGDEPVRALEAFLGRREQRRRARDG